MSARTILRLAVLLLLAAAAGAALIWFPTGHYLVAFAERVRDWGTWGPVLLAAVYVLSAVLLVPGSLVTLLAGQLGGRLDGLLAGPRRCAELGAAKVRGQPALSGHRRRRQSAGLQDRTLDPPLSAFSVCLHELRAEPHQDPLPRFFPGVVDRHAAGRGVV